MTIITPFKQMVAESLQTFIAITDFLYTTAVHSNRQSGCLHLSSKLWVVLIQWLCLQSTLNITLYLMFLLTYVWWQLNELPPQRLRV